MLRSYLRRMRMQPKEVRDRHAFVIAMVFTGLIAGAWVFTLVQSGSTDQQQIAKDTQPPFSGLLNQIKDQWASVQETMSQSDEVSSLDQSAAPEPQVPPGELRLTEETLEKLRQDSTGTTAWDGDVRAGENDGVEVLQEVQIVTVSSTASSSTEEF